jgi:hypothetical protein
MTEQQRIVVRVSADGAVLAETQGIVGNRCLDYIDLLEDLLDASTQQSAFSADYDRQAHDVAHEVSDELRQH